MANSHWNLRLNEKWKETMLVSLILDCNNEGLCLVMLGAGHPKCCCTIPNAVIRVLLTLCRTSPRHLQIWTSFVSIKINLFLFVLKRWALSELPFCGLKTIVPIVAPFIVWKLKSLRVFLYYLPKHHFIIFHFHSRFF